MMHMHIHLRVRNLNAPLIKFQLDLFIHSPFGIPEFFRLYPGTKSQDHGAVTQLIHENLRFFPLQVRILLDQFPEDLFCQKQIGFIGNSDLDLQPSFSIAVTFVILSFVSTEFGITIRRLSMVISVV